MKGRGRPARPSRPARPAAQRRTERPKARPSRAEPAVTPVVVPTEPFRLRYVEGATPAKWIRAWGEQMPQPLEHELVDESEQEVALRDGSADAAIVRLPITGDDLHVVRLYDERAFVVVPIDHPAADLDEVALADLADSPLLERGTMSWSELVEVVASGVGVATMPQSLARLHDRRDVASLPVVDLPPTTVALAWLRTRDGDDVQALAGIVRGRSPRSSR